MSEWDDLFARFLGAAEPRRAAQRIDITKYMSNDAREVLSAAARRAAETAIPGVPVADLDTDHLLWAVLQLEPMRALVRRAGADPDALLAGLPGPGETGELP
ncbi:ATP-dependent Clp protease ATP-binding subunit, partial [Actinoplanes sp. NPDC051633]